MGGPKYATVPAETVVTEEPAQETSTVEEEVVNETTEED